VRYASILLALVLVASLSWHYRFYECFHKIKVGLKASEEGKIAVAYRNLDAAAGLVPEDEELRDLATYYRGINFIENGIADSALECFQAVSGKINDQNLSFFKLEARMDIAFDEGEYDEFLKLSLEMKDILPENPMVIATVSSAYACKYATTSQGEYYQKSIQYLDGARAAAKDAPDFREYEQRILHRLSTKKIITKEEFDRLYPNSGQLARER